MNQSGAQVDVSGSRAGRFADGGGSVGTSGVGAVDVEYAPRLVHRLRLVDDLLRNGADAIAELALAAGGSGRILIVVDDGLERAAPGLAAGLGDELSSRGLVRAGPIVSVPGGEESKNSPLQVERLVRTLHDAALCRRSCLIALGGGAVLDTAGFAAATAHRGVRLIRVPTTTLSQADSCVAVKCGINAFGKKNYLGVFAAPWGVVIDPTLLRTLSERDWRCGFSEAVKVGLVKDPELFERIRAGVDAIRARDMDVAWPVVRRSAEIHLRHITDGGDPFELADARPLDFGHWAAHRLESLSGYRIKHGEAVATGIALDAAYSWLLGWLPERDFTGIRAVLSGLGFDLVVPECQHRALIGGLEEFREHLGGRLTVTMLRGIGCGFDVHEIEEAAMIDAIGRLREFAR